MAIVVMEQVEQPGCNSVSFHYRASGTMAVQYLVERGCRSVGFISSPLTRYSRRELYEGYLAGLKANGIEEKEEYICVAQQEVRQRRENGLYEYHNAIAQVGQMAESGRLPQAIFCGNDITAISAMQLLQKKGYRIPEDISVMGFDNIHLSEIAYPALTTIDQCIQEMGSMAADILINRINISQKDISITLQPKLVVRSSVR